MMGIADLKITDLSMFLANDLQVGLELVPIRSGALDEQLADGEFDVAMSAIEGTVARAERLPALDPYMYVTMAIVAPDHFADEFRTRFAREHIHLVENRQQQIRIVLYPSSVNRHCDDLVLT